MKSLRELYKIGRGPSSSHTMGPEKAAKLFEKEYPDADSFSVILYGSLAQTGKGHGTDVVLEKTFTKPVEIVFNFEETTIPHPNTLDLFAYKGKKQIGKWRVMSVGGSAIKVEGKESIEPEEVYPQKNFEEVKEYCEKEHLTLPQYVERYEGKELREYLYDIWKRMKQTIKEGLVAEGVLPGGLQTERKAKILYDKWQLFEDIRDRDKRLICAYAFAVSEQNAAGEFIVTAPTCGSCGIVPASLYYEKKIKGLTHDDMIDALCTAGVIGNIVKTNASISGAEAGCQSECGTACSMAAAAIAQLRHMSLDQIEYAAEVAMEHHLGLTCDPVCGLVQIPCIERNAVCAMRAIDAVALATCITSTRQMSFDAIVDTMYQTGKDLQSGYRETAERGMAETFKTSRLSSARRKNYTFFHLRKKKDRR